MKTTFSLLIAIAISIPALGGEASGEFSTSKREKIRPKYAAAFETRDQRDARKRVIEVVLSEEPVDLKAAVGDLDPHSNVINQPALMEHNYVLLWVRPANDVSMNATYFKGMTQFVDMTPGSLQADITTYTPDRVAGRLFTTKSVKTMGDETYSLDLEFSTDVTRAPAGTNLPAGGGEPGKALKALLAAMSKKNFGAIKENVTPKRVESFTDLDDALQTLAIWLPKTPAKVTGGELRGDVAVLELESDFFEGQRGLTLVQLVKSGPRWLFDRATRAGFVDSK
jgi:hypothetical protein